MRRRPFKRPRLITLSLIAAAVGGSASERAGSGEKERPWSLRELARPPVSADSGGWSQNAVDGFVAARLADAGESPADAAERAVWLRRLSFDLTGLPPNPAEVDRFGADGSPDAAERQVDRLLASPRYGERMARHWMDVARYAETHGHDEDAIRENAWPYRDYLIRAFNIDLPYAQFVREQIAGDVLEPGDPWATVATSFLACGPWDSSSQMGIQDGTVDKKVAQYLDRDEMLAATMAAFNGVTAHCARCHDHKFDPIPIEDYYALQAVFAGVDRADRPYDPDPAVAARRAALAEEKAVLESGALVDFDRGELAAWVSAKRSAASAWRVLVPEEATSEGGAALAIQPDGSVLSAGDRPEKDTYRLRATLPGGTITALQVEVLADPALPHGGPGRQDNGNLHLSEIAVTIGGQPVAIQSAAADFDQVGWGVARAIDGKPETAWGIYPEVGKSHRAAFIFAAPVEAKPGDAIAVELAQRHGGGHLIGRPRVAVTSLPDPGIAAPMDADLAALLALPESDLTEAQRRELALRFLRERHAAAAAALPPQPMVYAVASQFAAAGNFKPAGGPRTVHVLNRGDIHSPGEEATPGALRCVNGIGARFDAGPDEGARRAALADWLADPKNVLTWRTMANRLWGYHFGKAIAATPNDLGKMGAAPTHPELLDWLACELRETGSLKRLNRLIATSATYAQRASDGTAADRRLVRRQRLDAESIRDAALALSGALDLEMGGPSARHFNASKGVHVTPNLDYFGFDPAARANLRRSVYRLVFRTVPDPLMAALDCPDASQTSEKRAESTTALQALALQNSALLIHAAGLLANDIALTRSDPEAQVAELFRRAYHREPTAEERRDVAGFAQAHGLANACRVILNSSEFLYAN